MSEFPDSSSVTGRMGALTVVGVIKCLWPPWTFSARFWVFKKTWKAPLKVFRLIRIEIAYQNLHVLRTLYGLRWSVVHFEGEKRKRLIFETIFVGDWEQYLRLLVARTAVGIEWHAAGSVGFPGVENVELFLQYLFQRHRPASHVYAKSPFVSLVQLQQAIGSANEAPTHRNNWFGAVLRVRPGARDAITTLIEGWGDLSAVSPLQVDLLHHGRAVLIDGKTDTHLLLSACHAAPVQETVGHRASNDAADRAFLEALFEHDPAAWLRVLRLCVCDADTEDRGVDSLMARRYGVPNRRSIQWNAPEWDHTPAFLQQCITRYANEQLGKIGRP